MEKRANSFVEKWHSVYFFMPVFEQPVKMPSLKEFEQAMTGAFGRIDFLADSPQMPRKASDLLGAALWEHPAYYQKEDRSVPSQLVLYGPDLFDRSLWNDQIIAQFWDCQPDRQAFAARCRYSLMASNMMAANLPPMAQYRIMADYADLILELFPECIGIYWPHSQRLVPRESFARSEWNSPELHFLDGGLNIRFFNLTDSDEMLFDTLGLTAIGLPDLQLHCKELEPNDAVLFLKNLAAYLYRQGDVIQDGNTVEGIGGGKWPCRHEDALAGPQRVVLDILPGKYAGGGRA